ncbi:MAG: copper amine oxidase N-terminal domain-containing protein, partial [Firmicutes bacterium]|nr:copper amine oxidase N-terminal domain-containing protein [Bacillota bacterium]
MTFRTICALSAGLVLAGFIAFAGVAQATPEVLLDGQQISFKLPPFVEEGRILVPLRDIFESLGARVAWDNSTKTVTATKGVTTIRLQVGNNKAFKNNLPVSLDVPAKIAGDRTFVPLRFVSEALGAEVSWDESTETVTIKRGSSNSGPISKRNTEQVNSYMIHYGDVDEGIIALAKTYELVILHPLQANLTRPIVEEIQKGDDPLDQYDDVFVLGYISIGEDLRTVGLSDEEMKADLRFAGDGTGPRVDPRGPHPDGGAPLPENYLLGNPSPGGAGYASWYLDDKDMDGKPDRNAQFGGAFVNAGDPAWFETANKMTMDSNDRVPGLAEILTTHYGRGLGCDGVFL